MRLRTVALLAGIALLISACQLPNTTATPAANVPAAPQQQVPAVTVPAGQTGDTAPTPAPANIPSANMNSQNTSMTAPATTPTEPPAAPAVKEFKITARQWAFDPATITVNKGDRVKLVVTSIDVTHGLSIPAFNVNQNIEAGQTIIVEFVADQAGTFPYICSVFCGEGHGGMRGTLIVQ